MAVSAQDFIAPEELARRLAEKRPGVRVLDVRYSLTAGPLPQEHLNAHVPGAVFVDFPRELCGPVTASSGTQPLPDPAVFQRVVAGWGVEADTDVFVVGGHNGMAAARAWWLLRWGGHGRVQVVDGGNDNGVRSGLPVAAGAVPRPARAADQIRPGALPVLDHEGAGVLAGQGQLLDARARGAYDSVAGTGPGLQAGHIPGARSLPATSLVRRSGVRRPEGEIRRALEDSGVDPSRPLGVYCGGGIASSYAVLALHLIGITAALYPAGWSGWVSEPGRAVEISPCAAVVDAH